MVQVDLGYSVPKAGNYYTLTSFYYSPSYWMVILQSVLCVHLFIHPSVHHAQLLSPHTVGFSDWAKNGHLILSDFQIGPKMAD